MKKEMACTAALFVVLLWGTLAGAGIRKGPYLLFEGSNTQMSVLWQTDRNESNTLRWGIDTGYGLGEQEVEGYGTDFQHYYTITGLHPNTRYYYQVDGYGSGSFRTAPQQSATSVKMLAYGDSRSSPYYHERVAASMRTAYGADPAFQTIVLHNGDFVSSDSESYWASNYFVSPSSYPQMHALQAEVPMIGARGNHEGSGRVYEKYFPYPYQADFYWSFDYGPAHIVVLDAYTSLNPGSSQYNWLVSDLASTTKPWRIVMTHPPAWGAGSHGNDYTLQSAIHPLLVENGVQLFLNGHNHNYARAEVDGIQYITTGGGGAPLYSGDSSMPHVVDTDTSLHHLEIDIQGNDLTLAAVRYDGSIIESLSLESGVTPPNAPPVAAAGPDQRVVDGDGNGLERVVLDGSQSEDSDGSIVSYKWTENATPVGTGVSPSVDFAIGSHTVTLTVTDDLGAESTDQVLISVEKKTSSTSWPLSAILSLLFK